VRRALPTTSAMQHRRHHPGCRVVFIDASLSREEGGAGAPRGDAAMVGRAPRDAGKALPPPR
jgi:hypothetical protein